MSKQEIGRSQLGSASVLMAGILGIVVVLSSAALVIAGYAVGYRRARAAADLSALSAAAAFQHGGRDPCAQAALTARHNGAQVDSCSRVGDAVDFVVTVRVSVVAGTRLPHLPRKVAAEAHAGPVSSASGSSGFG
jgi:secretion/DNA translocation related TadE-like protein